MSQTKPTYKEGIFMMKRCTVIVSRETLKWHLSISTPPGTEPPTYDEIKEARYKFLPDNAFMAQIFPPQDDFVNIHPNCHHLWEIDGI